MAQRYIRLARNRGVIEAKTTSVSDLTLNGALALLTVPGTAEKTVTSAEALEAIQDKAEAARRQVIFDAIQSNSDAIAALSQKYVPADYVPTNSPDWLKEFFDELLKTVANNAKEFDLAVECGDHTSAFDLVSWAHDLSVDMRAMVEDIERPLPREAAP